MKGGVIIIGSLFWDDDPKRTKWRSKNLCFEEKIKVKLPIRYGRFSSTRCNTYTMVFSLECNSKGLGEGWIVPIKKDIASFDDLKIQAKRMGEAEGFQNSYYSDWGAVALLFNPQKINVKIMEKWSNFMSNNLTSHSLCCTMMNGEKPIVNLKGLLTLDWPKAENKKGKHDDIDFLLATVTIPKSNLGRYPNADEIAVAMIDADYYTYFIKNKQYGITTFQDDDISSKIKGYVKSLVDSLRLFLTTR